MHMSFRRDFFDNLRPAAQSHSVKIANDFTLRVGGIGTIKIREVVNGVTAYRIMTDVLFVPELKRNLFSISAVCNKGYSFHSFKNHCQIRNSDGKVSSTGKRVNNLFQLQFDVQLNTESACAAVGGAEDQLRIWHERMGHINVRAVQRTAATSDIDAGNAASSKNFFCEACFLGKQV